MKNFREGRGGNVPTGMGSDFRTGEGEASILQPVGGKNRNRMARQITGRARFDQPPADVLTRLEPANEPFHGDRGSVPRGGTMIGRGHQD